MAAKSVTVRDLPEAVHRTLSIRAATAGMSLQEYLKAELLRMAERPTPGEVVERARQRGLRGPGLTGEQIVEAVRAGRTG